MVTVVLSVLKLKALGLKLTLRFEISSESRFALAFPVRDTVTTELLVFVTTAVSPLGTFATDTLEFDT